MTLPKVEHPTYEVTLPSKDIKVKFRPFVVREEKILLIALENSTGENIVRAIKDIVEACTFNVLNIEELPIFDLEYLFLNIRAKSIGEVAKLKVLCPDDRKTYGDVEVDLSEVNVLVDENHTSNIVVDKDRQLGIQMKYPTINDLNDIDDVQNATANDLFTMIAKGIDYIYEGDKTYKAKDYTVEEMNEFLDSLKSTTLGEIKNFYDTSPKLKHEVKVMNPKTNVESTVVLQGLYDFFG